MKRLLHSMFAAGLAFGMTACENEKPADEATKSDGKVAAKADTKPEGEAKADPPEADEPEADEPEDDTANPDADPSAAEAPADEADDDLEGYDPRVAKAARIATQISQAPQQADDLLAAADLDREKLDALMYEIANDPDLTAQYRVARGI